MKTERADAVLPSSADLAAERERLLKRLEERGLERERALMRDPSGESEELQRLDAEDTRDFRRLSQLTELRPKVEQLEAEATAQERQTAKERLFRLLADLEARVAAQLAAVHATTRPTSAAVEACVTTARQVYALRNDLVDLTGESKWRGAWTIREALGPLVTLSPSLHRSPFDRKSAVVKPWADDLAVARGERKA